MSGNYFCRSLFFYIGFGVLLIKSIGIAYGFFFCLICINQNPIHMIPNKERLGIEIALRPHQTAVEIIQSELRKTEDSINRKWMHLDDYSNSWSWTIWKNWKDAMRGELSYREYLLIVLEAYKK